LRNRRNGGWLIGIGIALSIVVLILLTWANFRYATEGSFHGAIQDHFLCPFPFPGP